jgi:DNA-binding MarR family transcriptional regulator
LKDLEDWKEPDPIFRTFLLFQRTAQAVFRYSDMGFYSTLRFNTPVYIALQGILLNGGTATHTDMAYWTNTQIHNITGLVSRMAKAGLVTTERDLQDRRIIHILITEQGRKVYKKAQRVARENMQGVMKGISADQALELEKILAVLRENSKLSQSKPQQGRRKN